MSQHLQGDEQLAKKILSEVYESCETLRDVFGIPV